MSPEKTFKILLIEDNAGDARLLREMLKATTDVPFELEWVDRLAEGCRHLTTDDIDAVLLDLSLPDSQGLETFIHVQSIAPHVPITVLSGLDDVTLAVKAVRQGAQDYLVKGQIDSDVLVRAIRYAIERKQTEEALRESLQFSSSLLGNSPHPILVINPDMSIRYANPALEKLTGYAAKQLTDKKPPYPWWKKADETEGENLPQRIREGMRRVEKTYWKKNGDQFWVEVTSTPIRRDGDLRYHLVNWVDITERKQAEEEIRRRAAHLEGLNAVIAAAASASDLQTLLKVTLEHTLQALGLEKGAIWRSGQYVYQGLPYKERHIHAHEALATTLGIMGTTAVEDWQQIEADSTLGKTASVLTSLGVRASLTVPLLVEERRIGGLTIISSDQARQWTDDEIALAEAIGRQVGAAAERLRLFQVEQEQRELVEALQEAAALVSRTLDMDQVLDRILEQVERVVPGDAFNIMLLANGDKAHVTRWRGYRKTDGSTLNTHQRFATSQIPNLQGMIQTGDTIIVPDTQSDPEWVEFEGRAWLQSYIGAPIKVGGVTVGFLNVNGSRKNQFDTSDAQRLQAFADHAATAIQNAQLYQELRKYAEQLEARVQERTAQIETQYAQLEAILDSSSDGIIVTDEEGRIIQTNSVAEAWLTQTLTPKDATQLRETVRELAIRADERLEEVLELTGLDLELSVAPILNPAYGEAHTVVAVHDVSHLKALDRMKSRFVSNVSHELRTPITTIKLYAALMQRSTPDKWKEYLDALLEEADRQAQLVEDILQVSRIDAGRLEITPRPTSLNELIENAYNNHQLLAENKGLTLIFQPSPREPVALIDPNRTTQIIANLLSNAIQYTPQGGKIVISTGRTQTDDRTWATVTVSDTGMGIPENELPYIFDRFFRGEQPQLMQVSGTGLGLAIVKEIVELQGGQVTVQSEIEQGTTFTIWLSLVQQEDAQAAKQQAMEMLK